MDLNILINGANVLYLLSYSMRDILWLRILTVVAATLLIPYYYFQPESLMMAIYWNLVFTALNLYWITRLLMERRPARLTDDEQRLYRLVFRTLTPRKMLALLKLGSWKSAAKDECFVERGEMVDRLLVIFSGRACVELNGKVITELREGEFIGGISFIADEVAPANVIALEPTRYVSWPKSKLKKFLEGKPDLHTAIEMTLGVAMTHMLSATWACQT